jgi:hypothetical protein
MRNCCRRNMITICIALLLVVNVLGISCAKTLVDRIKKDIPVPPKGEVVYEATVVFNGRTVTGVVYDVLLGKDGAIEYCRSVLSGSNMKWTESAYFLDWLPIKGVKAYEFTIPSKDYRVFILGNEEIASSRCLLVVTSGYAENIYISGRENGGQDLPGLPRFPGSIRTLCLEYPGDEYRPPAIVLIYETTASVEKVISYFESMLRTQEWAFWYDFVTDLPMIPGVLSGFIDGRQCMVEIFFNEETSMTNIVVLSFDLSK